MKAKLDQQYWTNRYHNHETAWDAGRVTTPLKEYFDTLKNKEARILIPGSGNAYEAEYLISSGFKNIFVCDLALPPLEALKQRCPTLRSEQLIHGNFFELKNIKFDYVIEQTFFCAIDPSFRPSYFEKMSELLVSGGILAGVLFNDILNTDFPPFGGNKEEYLEYIPSDFEIVHFETCRNSIAPRAGRELFMQLKKR